MDEEVAVSLRYALERGAEAEFEDTELDSQALPDLEGRGGLLLTESAEGGAGRAARGLRLPDRAQVYVPEVGVRPDFVYERPGSVPVAVFVDGPVHDAPRQAERDVEAEERLIGIGWAAVRVRYDDWSAVVARHPSTFGVGPAR